MKNRETGNQQIIPNIMGRGAGNFINFRYLTHHDLQGSPSSELYKSTEDEDFKANIVKLEALLITVFLQNLIKNSSRHSEATRNSCQIQGLALG